MAEIREKLGLVIAIIILVIVTAVVAQESNFFYFTNFTAGELSPKLYGRMDFDRYNNGAKTLTNMIVYPQGPTITRPGTYYVAGVSDQTRTTRLIPFEYSTAQAYMIEAGHYYMRFYKDQGQIWNVDSNTVMLLHMDIEDFYAISNVSTNFIDSGTSPYTITVYGDSEINSDASKFGNASGYFPTINGSTSYLEIDFGGSTDFQSGASDFTIDFWLKTPDATIATNYKFFIFESGSTDYATMASGETGMFIYFDGSATYNRLSWEVWDSGTSELHYASNVTPTTSWVHYSLIKGWGGSGTTWAVTQNGSSVTEILSSRQFVYSGVSTIKFFKHNAASGENIINIDEFRYSNNARWTTNYSVMTESYPTADNSGEVYQITTPYPESALADLKYAQSEDTLYIAHPNYEPYKLTRSDHANWSGATVNFTENILTSAASGYPSAVEFFEQRLCWGGSNDFPQTVWMSKSGEFEDLTQGADDGDAIVIALAASSVNAIRWMKASKNMAVGTMGGEWIIGPLDPSDPITPSNIQAKRHTENGCLGIQPVIIEDDLIFVQRSGRGLYSFYYNFERDKYISKDLMVLSDHLLESETIVDIAFQQKPYSILWCVLSDGTMIALTYLKDEKVLAWHTHTTSGEFEDLAVIPASDGNDELWITSTRNSGTSRYIEYMVSLETITIEDMIYLDSTLSYSGSAATSFSGLDHLSGLTVAVLADGDYVGEVLVTDGVFTISQPASDVHAGLNYTSTLETLDLPEIMGMEKIIREITVRFYRTCQAKIGATTSTAGTVDWTYSGVTPYTGYKDFNYLNKIEKNQNIVFLNDEPLPMGIAQILVNFDQ